LEFLITLVLLILLGVRADAPEHSHGELRHTTDEKKAAEPSP